MTPLLPRSRARQLVLAALPLVLAGVTTAAVPPAVAATKPSAPRADLRVDANRDGRVDLTGSSDEAHESRASNAAGALYLANVDDDSLRCRAWARSHLQASQEQAARCNDASDRRVNGARDAQDLAEVRVAPMAGLSGSASGTLTVHGATARQVQLFWKRNGVWRPLKQTTKLPRAALRRGMQLGLEGRVLRTSPSGWDGTVRLRLTVRSHGTTSTDLVALSQAPALTSSHLSAVQDLFFAVVTPRQGTALDQPTLAAESRKLAPKLRKDTARSGARLQVLHNGEMFPQDHFEAMYASVPRPGGRVHTMRILLAPADAMGANYTRLRGRDVGVFQAAPDPTGRDGDFGATLSATGNLETIPPYTWRGRSYPNGRVIMGRDPGRGQRPAPSITQFIKAQGRQAPLYVDTGWTFVKHVDESIQFIPADTPRGWKMVVADPLAGLAVLRKARRAGHGGARLFSRKAPYTRLRTLDDYFNDPDRVLVRENTWASAKVEKNIRTVRRETGLTAAEIVRVPALFGSIELEWGHDPGYRSPLTALFPNPVNSVVMDRHRVLVPRQYGPRVQGRDLFNDAVARAYRRAGMQPTFRRTVVYSIGDGDLHCATNVYRRVTGAWWRQR